MGNHVQVEYRRVSYIAYSELHMLASNILN